MGKVFLFIAIFFLLAPPTARLFSLIIHRFDGASEIPGLIPTTIVALVLFFAWLAHVVGRRNCSVVLPRDWHCRGGFFSPSAWPFAQTRSSHTAWKLK